jgi:hypothetical protein
MLGHTLNEPVIGQGHCDGEEGGGDKARDAEVECFDLTLWTFYEVGTIYATGAKT